MVGYPESLTDPSYAGQILVITFPLVGNYGVPSEDELDSLGLMEHFESNKIHVKAVVVSDYSFTSSHYTAKQTLSQWLSRHKIPGIYGVDTRALTKLIRQHGAILGKVTLEDDPVAKDLEFDDPNKRNLPAEVSRTEKQVFVPPAAAQGAVDTLVNAETIHGKTVHILVVDLGVKNNILRYLVNVMRVKATVVPWNFDFTTMEFDGLFLSNGPGDPTMCDITVQHVRTIMQQRPMVPIFGICLGNQILALAAGAKTYKMKFGNRGMNQPFIDMRTTR
jgi:carbamoyl-phosphate synthase small subunit